MNNKLTDELLEQLATLSKLEVSDSDKTELRKDLAQMLAYVDKLRELNTEGTPPLTHFPECTRKLDTVCAATSASSSSELRKDVPCQQPDSEQFVTLAPKQADGHYVVPNTF